VNFGLRILKEKQEKRVSVTRQKAKHPLSEAQVEENIFLPNVHIQNAVLNTESRKKPKPS